MPRVRWLDYVLLAALFLSVTSCSSNDSPAGPSSSTTPASGGATIFGSVSGTSSPSGIHPDAVSSSITVTVQGTGISATVSAGESFTLSGVPTGDIVLQFSGAATGQFTIPAVQNQEQIRVSVSVSGTSLTFRITQRTTPASSKAQVTGSVTALNATARTLVVDGVTVSVPTNAVIRQGEKTLMFGDLMMGEHVQATGTFNSSTLVASEVDIQGGESEDDRS